MLSSIASVDLPLKGSRGTGGRRARKKRTRPALIASLSEFFSFALVSSLRWPSFFCLRREPVRRLHKGRIPLNQNSLFEFPRISSSDWNNAFQTFRKEEQPRKVYPNFQNLLPKFFVPLNSPVQLYTWMERRNGRVTCLAQKAQHNALTKAVTRTDISGVQRTKHEAKALSIKNFNFHSACMYKSISFLSFTSIMQFIHTADASQETKLVVCTLKKN